ncbi:LuxR C-terminal-related transcriptional regulator [Acetobacter senegalensis]|uniref:LuxR C-terminal-related transcriptional regulator n=1 Tax=Acetobacter senegalensis TaxID=446692 RepID=UPI001EDC5E66|nr:LuxR C-terminal-related transcriptional regulator [Acetobacter senegalensis]MCG4254231.1 LuxR C-terminal-related transcriptional regulator [Acetobacter senegalensis]
MAKNAKIDRLTDEQRAVMVKEYLAGVTCKALTERFGCGKETLRRYIKSAVPPGQYRHGSAPVITDALLKQAIALSNDGMARKEIAERLGVNLKTLGEALRKRGVSIAKRTCRPRRETIPIIVDGLKRGLSKGEIAKQLGVAEITINNYYKDAMKRLGSSQKPTAPEPKPVNIEHLSQEERNAIAANAMWRGLERWRGANR